jgi:predicted ester cyclase
LGIGSFSRTKTVNIQIAEGDMVFTYFTVEGIHDTGEIMGYPATGKHIRYNAQYTVRVREETIIEIWATMDGHIILKQLGIVK